MTVPTSCERQVLRELKEELTKEEYAYLKGTMWIFRRDPGELTKGEEEQLALLLECAPDLKRARSVARASEGDL